jgi:hypothetical protein
LGIGAGGAPSANIDDGASTWEDVEEGDKNMTAVIDRSNMVDNQEIVEDIEEKGIGRLFYLYKERELKGKSY